MEQFGEVPSFTSADQEIAYWKARSHFYQSKYEDQRDQFDEFVKYSKDIEQELELELKQHESQNKELKSTLNRFIAENESLRNRMDQMNAEYNAQLTELTTEITSCRTTSDEVNAYVRELEQKNDDLERANRAALVSIQDFEQRLNAAIERNAILESELDETETLKEMVQRLKDETKDLEGELLLKRGAGTPSTPQDNKDAYRSSNGEPKGCRSSPLSVVHDLLRKFEAIKNNNSKISYDWVRQLDCKG
ncbi:unnamed protein product [Allacma fusca]|uniref:NUDE domain-containing protein n=1 Tax=Allacma fusca TaxID=39272 RepID=A0A8J2PZB7_9HEXA|nr:unnamed protein product [Allacma fusca]